MKDHSKNELLLIIVYEDHLKYRSLRTKTIHIDSNFFISNEKNHD